mgnify:FL=1
MKIGIMGCGVISKQYIQDIQRLYRELEICMVADVHSDVAERTAQQYNILRWGTPDELLNDTETELIINLTPPKMHTEVNRKILLAGKHVYCEKPFALTLEKHGKYKNWQAKKGLAVGCAPDTIFG